ncbi:transcriptional repressor [Candidatus Woesearchaeota archaeon]|nr:transcriptional repressor [Candidatus Woesearchaeota archaeon]
MAKKIRNTKQKDIIMHEIENMKEFFSAEELYRRVMKKDSSIGVATIYRMLKDLVEKKDIFAYTCDRRQIYSKDNKSHCHYHCLETGKTMHIDIDSIDFLKKKIPGTISHFQIEVFGTCDDCKR